MKRGPLWLYVAGVLCVLALTNWIAFAIGGVAKFAMMEHLSFGFILGMLAMYIAMHLYRWK
jgi:hypothetical protein